MEKLGRFDHHPDPAIDYEIEVQIIEGLNYDVNVSGTGDRNELQRRVFFAADFIAKVVPSAIRAQDWLKEHFPGAFRNPQVMT